jgi:hypothetical protein
MFKQATHHATAVALAALTTLATLAGLDAQAAGQYATATLVARADAAPADYQVVVTARRISQV